MDNISTLTNMGVDLVLLLFGDGGPHTIQNSKVGAKVSVDAS